MTNLPKNQWEIGGVELNQIHHGDCLEVMKGIPDKSVEMILSDPPY